MPTRTPISSQIPSTLTASHPSAFLSCNIRELISLAANGLVAMFDADKQLFCHRLLRTEQGLVREGLSPRYTIMTVLGLRELELAGMDSPFDARAIYASFIRDTSWIRGLGDLGLLIWFTAAFDPAHLGALLSKFDCEAALDRFPDAQAARTMELAWFLAALAHAAETSPQLCDTLTNLSLRTYQRLKANQGDYGLFGHMGTKNSFAGRLRGRVGSFADQVYPVYAMSKYSQVFGVEEALIAALACAKAICGAQGELGQWWWLYDARNGRVSSRYPVYSVHQHGMAPMALFAVEEASGKNFSDSIYKGLRWLYGANELGIDMIDSAQKLIWRCVLPENKFNKYWEMASSRVRSSKRKTKVGSLKILYEQRPYEYGWLLFAFAKKAGIGSGLRDA
jgi:hypothetical protein